ncbi:MAG TPA: acyl-CoA dehydrogenase family protein [Acidimicrobiales bacterium]|nr:acyl-CoA dehydrogenase family protein [Acidimicrobiales bacterium]
MDFNLDDDQRALRDLAGQIFGGGGGWSDLADADLLGLCIPEAHGGSGRGLVELCLVLEAQGRALADVPLLETIALGALPLARFGTDVQQKEWLPAVVRGDVVLTAAFEATAVPAGDVADRVLVVRPDGVFLSDPQREVVATTDQRGAANITFTGGEPLPGADVDWMRQRAHVALAALQLGVAKEALRRTAEYTSQREQFGKPLSSFQGVALRAADAYIDTEAMEVTMLQAAWRLDNGLEASKEVAIAKWWAAEGGERVVYATQHLHGGMGADVDYPIHRYFLWGKQIANALGGASSQLARLGALLAEQYR